MKNKLALIEDQSNQYIDIIEKIKSFEFEGLEIMDLGITKEYKYSDYIDRIKSESPLPSILLVDYELAWKARSSSVNGQELINETLTLYETNRLPFIIYISYPHEDEILKASHEYKFIDEAANSIALDKSKFDLKHANSGLTNLEFVIHKAIVYNNKKYSTLHLKGHSDYPDLESIHNAGKSITKTQFLENIKKLKDQIEIEISDILLIIFKTSYDYDLMFFVIMENGKLKKYLKRMEGNTVSKKTKYNWINDFRDEGIEFHENGPMLYNQDHFEYIKKTKEVLYVNDKNLYNELNENLLCELNYQFDRGEHPFKNQIKLIEQKKISTARRVL